MTGASAAPVNWLQAHDALRRSTNMLHDCEGMRALRNGSDCRHQGRAALHSLPEPELVSCMRALKKPRLGADSFDLQPSILTAHRPC
jgi:hypothetical protein